MLSRRWWPQAQNDHDHGRASQESAHDGILALFVVGPLAGRLILGGQHIQLRVPRQLASRPNPQQLELILLL